MPAVVNSFDTNDSISCRGFIGNFIDRCPPGDGPLRQSNPSRMRRYFASVDSRFILWTPVIFIIALLIFAHLIVKPSHLTAPGNWQRSPDPPLLTTPTINETDDEQVVASEPVRPNETPPDDTSPGGTGTGDGKEQVGRARFVKQILSPCSMYCTRCCMAHSFSVYCCFSKKCSRLSLFSSEDDELESSDSSDSEDDDSEEDEADRSKSL
uniref:Uncharacterized protein n=1 Tax=Anopheles farauti TaxID=69004 RepID=A0A182QWB9_9DIPT